MDIKLVLPTIIFRGDEMSTRINLNAVNQIEKGSVLYEMNQKVDTISLILKGRTLVYNNGVKTLAGSGSFLGISDYYQGIYMNNYIAYDNLVIFTFSIEKKEDIERILKVNKDYAGLMVAYLNKYLNELDKTMRALKSCGDHIFDFLRNSYEEYIDICRKSGHVPSPIRGIEELQKYESDIELDLEKVAYYSECAKIPNDILKDFFSYSNEITLYNISEQSKLIQKLNEECNQLALYIAEVFEGLINKETDCLYKVVAKLILDIVNAGGKTEELLIKIDEIVENINRTEKLFVEKAGYKLESDREKMEEIYFLLLTGEQVDKPVSTDIQMRYTSQEAEKAETEMQDSLLQIFNYAMLSEEEIQNATKLIADFANLRDKTSSEDSARRLRREITEFFYNIYLKIFIKAYKEKQTSRIIDLFLNYGYIDEKLLTQEQCIELYFLGDESSGKGPCKVFNMKEWLTEIYEGRREPSKSEFDLDYAENLRDIKKRQNVTKEEERDYLTNPLKKLEYEIKNVFSYNNRIVNGQISIFVPILYQENLNQSLTKLFVTKDMVNKTIQDLLKIDYSAFYREVLYYDYEKGIKKEYIMKEVFPDIILFPTVGVNSVMWQEITGKKRDTSGRFLLPIFCEGDLFEMLIKAFGRFRFELCRTIQGTAWNNISERSLTSEYVDYIQFYRKNRELTEEKREKIKSQIQKGRNNMREIFLIDYVLWIKSESNGAIRINKVARDILATYCPFSKNIREKLMLQPLFEEAMARYNREKFKKRRECELRIRALEKEGIEVTDEIKVTQHFYNDL